MNKVKLNFMEISFCISLAFSVICAYTQKPVFNMIFFIAIVMEEIYCVLKKDMNGIIYISIQILPCIGILTFNSMPLHNIILACSLFFLMIGKNKIHIPKAICAVYIIIVLMDFIKYMCNLGNYELSLINVFSVFVLYLSIFYSIVVFYHTRKNSGTYIIFMKAFIRGTFVSIVYGIIFRTLKYGIKYAILSPTVAFRNYGASTDPNYFGFYITLAVSFILILYLKKEKNLVSSMIISVFFLVAGFSSISRMFLILCIPIVLYLVVIWVKDLFSQRITYAIMSIIILIVITVFFKPYIFNNINLIINRLDVDSSSDITNGRADLATGYVDIINSSPRYSLFGVGISKYYKRLNMPLYAHNFYIELYVCYGLIGVILFAITVLTYLLKNKFYKYIIYFLPILIILLAGLAISFIEVECIYVLIAVALAVYNCLVEEKSGKNEKSVTYS